MFGELKSRSWGSNCRMRRGPRSDNAQPNRYLIGTLELGDRYVFRDDNTLRGCSRCLLRLLRYQQRPGGCRSLRFLVGARVAPAVAVGVCPAGARFRVLCR